MKKVSAVSAVAILAVAVAPLFNKASADDGTTVLSGAACETSAAATTFDVDFGAFNGSNVLTDQYLLSGTLGGNSKSYVAVRNGSGSLNTGDTGTLDFISVADTCGDDSWVADVLFSDMDSAGLASTFTIPADAIKFVGNTSVYYLGSTALVANNEVQAYAAAEGGDAGGDSNDDLVFNGTANPNSLNDAASWEAPLDVLERTVGGSANMMAGEFGIRPDISIFVPQYQPAGTYNGTITVTVN